MSRAASRTPASRGCARFLVAALLAMTASRAARAAEIFGTFRHWTVLRITDRSAPQCSLATRAADGLLRMDLEPIGNGGIMIAVSVTSGPKEPRTADDRVGISWMPREGQIRVVTYPILGSRVLSGPPIRLFAHTILRKPADVAALVNEASASAGVLVSLDPGYDEPLPTAGFADAWAALKTCDPARTALLPGP